jgi:hypothetical protein
LGLWAATASGPPPPLCGLSEMSGAPVPFFDTLPVYPRARPFLAGYSPRSVGQWGLDGLPPPCVLPLTPSYPTYPMYPTHPTLPGGLPAPVPLLLWVHHRSLLLHASLHAPLPVTPPFSSVAHVPARTPPYNVASIMRLSWFCQVRVDELRAGGAGRQVPRPGWVRHDRLPSIRAGSGGAADPRGERFVCRRRRGAGSQGNAAQ